MTQTGSSLDTGCRTMRVEECADRKEAVYLLDDVAEAEKAGRKFVKPQAYAVSTMQPHLHSMTVSELLDQYVEMGKAEWQPSTLYGIQGIVRNYICPYIGDTPIAAVTPHFIQRAGLREVDFYSLRHAGATAKLRASRNIKALQGDMGHASPEILTKVYATIVDEDRKQNAQLMQSRVFDKLDPADSEQR